MECDGCSGRGVWMCEYGDWHDCRYCDGTGRYDSLHLPTVPDHDTRSTMNGSTDTQPASDD